MSRDDRRDALVEVFVDLAHREGRKPTTSEIAQEAGVAEGTIFRVFATKEALGGFDIIECGSLDEAVEIAAGHPLAEIGTIEVRPFWGN